MSEASGYRLSYLQRLTCVVALAFAISVFPLISQAGDKAVDPRSKERITRIEAALPPVKHGERTLELSLTQWMEALAIPGLSIAVIDDHRIAWVKSYGNTEKGQGGQPVTANTIFQAASVSKPVVAIAVLNQVERGIFDLDADIDRYLRSWKLPASSLQGDEAVTIRRLLAHTGGITPGGFAGYARSEQAPTLVQVLNGAAPATNRDARVMSIPGSEVNYSGLGYAILQLALEDQLDKPFETIMQETVLQPLELKNSTFEQVLSAQLESRAARGHRRSGDIIEGGWTINPELAAAGLWTTPTDLAKLVISVAKTRIGNERGILSSDMTHQMLSQHRDGMGLGFVVRNGNPYGYFAHSGGNQGYFAHFEILAESGKGIVVMANSDAGQLLASLVIASVAREYEWPMLDRKEVSTTRAEQILTQIDHIPRKRTRIALEPRILSRYVGKYELSPGMQFDVTLADAKLLVRLGDQPQFQLFAESESKFFLDVVDAQITFVLDEAGKASKLILHQGGRDQDALKID